MASIGNCIDRLVDGLRLFDERDLLLLLGVTNSQPVTNDQKEHDDQQQHAVDSQHQLTTDW